MINERIIKRFVFSALSFSLVSIICSVIILSLVPPVSRDALTHHLAVPKLYLEGGGIREIPWIPFSYFPMNLDLLYMIPLYFGNDIVPKFIHFAFALLTAWRIFSFLKKRTDSIHALFGVVLFLSLPVIFKLSITVYVDLGLIFFSTQSILSLFQWIKKDYPLKHLMASALWLGLAMGTKYNGLIVFFVLSLFVLYIYAGSKGGGKFEQLKAIRQGVLVMGVALVVFSPWMIKNYIWTNNPIYPLYDNIFNPPEVEEGASEGGSIGHFVIRSINYNEPWYVIALTPVRIFFMGQDNNPKYYDGELNPLLFFLPFFAFCLPVKEDAHIKKEKKILLAFSALYFIFAFFSADMRIRYIAPIIPPLVMLSVMGLHGLTVYISNTYSPSISGKLFVLLIGCVSFLLFFNASYIYRQCLAVDPLGYISGKVGREEYIEKYRPDYGAIKYANENLGENAKILALFLGNRSYYSNREMHFDAPFFEKVIRKATTENQMESLLREKGITHIIMRYDLLQKWVNDNFNEEEKNRLKNFINKETANLFSKGGYGLFELREAQ